MQCCTPVCTIEARLKLAHRRACTQMCLQICMHVQAFGRIPQNKLVYFDGDGVALRGKLVHVHVHECKAYSLFGSIVPGSPAQDVPEVERPREVQMMVAA